jgi:two-component system, sensor histidine kinase and response regulator
MSQEHDCSIFFGQTQSGVLETSLSGLIVNSNSAIEHLLGRSRHELLNSSITIVLASDAPNQIQAHLDRLQAEGVNRSELQVKGSTENFLNLDVSSVRVEGNRFIHTIDDVTASRKKTMALLDAAHAADAANRAKGDFLANVSHEIRTPMHGIMGLTQLVLMTQLNAQQRDYLEKISQSSKTLMTMLNDLLDFSKIESGKLEFERCSVDLFEILDELAVVAAHSSIGKNIEIIFNIDNKTPRLLLGDRLRIAQILINLISNAVKFTDQGHVVLSVSTCTTALEGSTLTFAVSDTGNGISDETLSRLFRPFTQADAATTRRYGGTGLGLVIAKQLSRGMGGELSVSSIWGEGSTFTLQIPLLKPEDSAPVFALSLENVGPIYVESCNPFTRKAVMEIIVMMGGQLTLSPNAALCIHDLAETAHSPTQLFDALTGPVIFLADAIECARLKPLAAHRSSIEILTRPLTPSALARALQQIEALPTSRLPTINIDIPDEFRGATIAVAEDMEVNQQVILGLLEMAGIHVYMVDNGKALIHLLDTLEVPPELIFMDMHMQVMDGFEATRFLRKQGFSQPIVALSAGVSVQERSRCLDSGISDFLPKPIDLDELWGVLTRWLKPRQATNMESRKLPKTPALCSETNQKTGIQIDEALPRFLGNTVALHRAIALFLVQHQQDANDLRNLLKTENISEFKKLVHALKGTAATVGATTLAHIANQLEEAAAQVNRSAVYSLIEDMEREIEKIKATFGSPDF